MIDCSSRSILWENEGSWSGSSGLVCRAVKASLQDSSKLAYGSRYKGSYSVRSAGFGLLYAFSMNFDEEPFLEKICGSVQIWNWWQIGSQSCLPCQVCSLIDQRHQNAFWLSRLCREVCTGGNLIVIRPKSSRSTRPWRIEKTFIQKLCLLYSLDWSYHRYSSWIRRAWAQPSSLFHPGFSISFSNCIIPCFQFFATYYS